MNVGLNRIIDYILIVLILLLGIYHLGILFVNNELIKIEKEFIYSIHRISYNLTISLLLFWKFDVLKKIKIISKKHKYLCLIFSIYFIMKIIANILITYFNISFDINIAGIFFSLMILILFLFVKILK